MATNETQSFCGNTTQNCDKVLSSVYVSVNIVSCVINILHILVLQTISKLRESNYFWILFNINLADMLVAIFYVFGSSCLTPWLEESDYGFILSALIIIGVESSSTSRYFQLMLASLDRYYAVCRPFEYSDSRLLNNVGKLSLIGWIIIILLSATQISVAPYALCFHSLGPYIKEHRYTAYFFYCSALFMSLLSISTTFFLIKTTRELRRMKSRSMTDEDKEVKSATKYIVVTCIFFYSTVIPFTLYLIVRPNLGRGVFEMATAVFGLFQSMYGALNVVMFGLSNQAYRNQIKSIICSHCRGTRVHPA